MEGRMTPTRPLTLVLLGVICAVFAWLVVRISYSTLPLLPWSAVPALLLLAAAEGWTGRNVRTRIRANRIGQAERGLNPLAVARLAVLAKATSHGAAVFGGLIAGFLAYVSGSLDKPIPRGEAVTAAVTLASALALIAAAVYLERCCRAPAPPGPAGRQESRGLADGQPAGLRVGVVGAGRAGTAMAAALARAGHQVVAASAISRESVARATRMLPGAVITQPEKVTADADLVLLTVPDDVLPGLVSGLAATGAALSGRLLVHASGRHGLAVLSPAVRAGALPLALHPVMTFTGRGDDVDRMAGISFGVTAPEPLRNVAEALVVEMGGEPVFIAEERRDLYHAALASAANHLVTLVVTASDLLGEAGVEDPAARSRMLGPLLSAALDNALRLGDDALTGPVARGDADTVASHIAALRAVSPEALAAYLALARLTADRALAAGTLAAPDAQRLLGVLAGAPG